MVLNRVRWRVLVNMVMDLQIREISCPSERILASQKGLNYMEYTNNDYGMLTEIRERTQVTK